MNTLKKVLNDIKNVLFRFKKLFFIAIKITLLLSVISLIIGKTYQNQDDDPDRGAIAVEGAFGESYSTPIYLSQGWDEDESLWFYNITQDSTLLLQIIVIITLLKNLQTPCRYPFRLTPMCTSRHAVVCIFSRKNHETV